MVRRLLVFLLVLVAALLFLSRYGIERWQSVTDQRLAALEAQKTVPTPETVDFSALDALPEPVRRYLTTVLTDGQPLVAAIDIEHAGTFNLDVTKDKWAPFTSRQRVVVQRPGFLWDGRIDMAPGLTVLVHDAYVEGTGILQAKLFGLIPVMEMSPSTDLDKGELLRFFAESAWYPTALLPGQGVTWEAVDDSTARARLVDDSTEVALTFSFGADGLVASVRAEERGFATDNGIVPTPWEGRWEQYERRSGMLVPTGGEVSWIVDGERRPYWRGRITAIEYEM